MTPARLRRRTLRPLPAPELVNLLDDPEGPYADSPEGWWTERGGAQDPVSGVVYFPPGSNPPPSPFHSEHK
ncbi:hypothetical protein ACIOKD_05405 [Streptomyces sp. NPDC087844]|uniref:hypothetical protein n=1 Tax=Streptomyces sp. NPDC087844 TaxID=3365805 RepID=UPI00382FC107